MGYPLDSFRLYMKQSGYKYSSGRCQSKSFVLRLSSTTGGVYGQTNGERRQGSSERSRRARINLFTIFHVTVQFPS